MSHKHDNSSCLPRATYDAALALSTLALILITLAPLAACSLPHRGQQPVMVPMRDGVRLATDLYFPLSGSPPWPAILIRTPYMKERYAEYTRMFTSHGYVVAVQDVRGRFASEGEWLPFVQEGPDGFETIEWMADQDWSTGKIGMIGSSYDGFVQFAAAVEHPPHLATIVPNVSVPDPWVQVPYEQGVFSNYSIIWTDIVESEATADLSGQGLQRIRDRDWAGFLEHLPVVELDERVFGREIPYYREWVEHSTYDDYWKQGPTLEKVSGLSLPVFLQSGWFDENTIGTQLAFLALAAGGHEHVKLIMGPWGHTPFAETHFRGEFMGEEAMIDLVALRVRWFDYWLKGIDTGILEEPLVQLYAMGPNTWLYADTYPLPETDFTRLYLVSERGAQPGDGGGHLQLEPPSSTGEFDSYTYNPGDPTPDPFTHMERGDLDGYERLISVRDDLLVYETSPFEEPLTIMGPISATLYASSSAKDTDWFVTLYQVDADGNLSRFISRGMIRARFRDSLEEPRLLQPGEVYPFDLQLVHTGRTLTPGTKLRLVISSALHPIYSRNLNTGGHNEMESEYVIANQRIYRDAEHPSHIVIPVVRLPHEVGSEDLGP
jgi:putative CocE/NonD family hydrolase